MSSMNIMKPRSIDELKSCLNESTEKTNILAGGTDLVISLREKCMETDHIIDISGLDSLDYINMDSGVVSIGAITTFTEIEKNEIIKKYANCLSEASQGIGSKQIRNIGTIGGNIANASPAGDCITALVALKATVEVLDKSGEYSEMSISDLIIGPGAINLNNGQVITKIMFKPLESGYKSYFTKIGNRKTVTIARINLSVVIKTGADNSVEDIIIALGAVGKKSFRDYDTEKSLKGLKINEELFKVLELGLKKTIENSIPNRQSMPYKSAAVKGLVSDLADLI